MKRIQDDLDKVNEILDALLSIGWKSLLIVAMACLCVGLIYMLYSFIVH